jgi:hypothetical protein
VFTCATYDRIVLSLWLVHHLSAYHIINLIRKKYSRIKMTIILLSDLPLEMIQHVLSFLNPGGDTPFDALKHDSYADYAISTHKRNMLQQRSPAWYRHENLGDWTEFPANWTREALKYALVGKQWHYVLVEDRENDALFWMISALDLIVKLSDKTNNRTDWIEPAVKTGRSNPLDSSKPGRVKIELVRLTESDVNK